MFLAVITHYTFGTFFLKAGLKLLSRCGNHSIIETTFCPVPPNCTFCISVNKTRVFLKGLFRCIFTRGKLMTVELKS